MMFQEWDRTPPRANIKGVKVQGSEVVRFFGNIAYSDFHVVKNASGKPAEFICTEADNCICKSQESGYMTFKKGISIVWSVDEQKWRYFLADPSFFSSLAKSMKEKGVPLELFKTGKTPDVVIQRVGYSYEYLILMETMSKSRGDILRPDLGDVLKVLRSNSIWRLVKKVKDITLRDPNITSSPVDPVEVAIKPYNKKSPEDFLTGDDILGKEYNPPPPLKKIDLPKKPEDSWDIL